MQEAKNFIKNIFRAGKQHKGMNLKQLRESKGLTQKQLAEMIGIKDASSICNYERGRRTPDLKIIRKIADVFDISFEESCNIFLYYKVSKRK